MPYVPRLSKKKLGEILVEAKVIREEVLQKTLTGPADGKLLGEKLVALGLAKEEDIAMALARQYALPYLDASKYSIAGACKDVIPAKLQAQNRCVVLDKFGNTLLIAISGAIDIALFEEWEQKFQHQIFLCVSTVSQVRDALRNHYGMA